MCCFKCGRTIFTYRGLCVDCAPELHAAYEERQTYWNARFAQFRRETGVEPLADWSRFEAWCESDGVLFDPSQWRTSLPGSDVTLLRGE